MGNFYVSFATRGPDQDAVVRFLQAARRAAYVSPTVNGITVFFDKESDSQDDSIIISLGKRASNSLRAPVMAVINHDDDLLLYWLFEGGKMVDEYNSCPGYFTGGNTKPSGGNATRLSAAFGFPSKSEEVNRILRNEEFAFALDRHEALAGLLNQPWPYVCLGYSYAAGDNLPEGVTKEDLIRIT